MQNIIFWKFANSTLCEKLQNLNFANIQTRKKYQIYSMSFLTDFVDAKFISGINTLTLGV